MTWGSTPSDLDIGLKCADGSVIGQKTIEGSIQENRYGKVYNDRTNSYGPECLIINKWFDEAMADKIGGDFDMTVKWAKDSN